MALGRDILERELDLGGFRTHNPAAPVNPDDVVRLQDLTSAISALSFEHPLTFSQGLTRVSNAVTGDYITGVALGGTGRQTTWTGGTGTGEGLLLQSTKHATKGFIGVGASNGILAINEATGLIGIGQNAPLAALHITTGAGSTIQMRFGQFGGGGGDYTLGRSDVDGLVYLTSTHGSIAGFIVTNPFTGDRFRVDTSGIVTIPNLGGGSAAMVKSSTTGALQRAVAGTDFQAPLSAADATINFPTATTVKVGTLSNKFIVQGTADAQLSGAQFLGALTTGLVKNTTTTGVLSIAVGGTDYENPLTFSTGLTRVTNTITADISTGKGSGQTAFGGTAASGTLTLSSTANATKGMINFGTSTYDEVNNRLGLGIGTPTNTLHVKNALSTQIRFGADSSGTADYTLGRNTSTGFLEAFSTNGTTGGFIFGKGSTAYVTIDNSSNLTVAGLAGSGSVLVKTSATGLLARGVPGTDYENPLTFASGLTRATNTVTGDYITGVAVGGSGDTVWTGGTGTGEGIQIRSTSHATKGHVRVGSIYLDEANTRIGIGSSVPGFGLDLLVSGDIQMRIGAGAGTSYQIGRNGTDGLLYFIGQQTGFAGYIFSGATGGTRMQIADNGNVFIPGLGGGSATLVKTSTIGLLSRAAAGTDYQAPLTFTQGVTLTGSTVTGDYITGAAGNQTWIGSTTNGGTLTIESSSGTRGLLTLDGSKVSINGDVTSPTNSLRLQVAGFNGFVLTQAGRIGLCTTPGSTQIVDTDMTQSLTPAATDSLDAFLIRGATETINGTAHVTTTTGYNFVAIKAPTYTKGSTATIDIGATVAISGPPGGTAAPATAYPLWVQSGTSRFDGTLVVGGDINSTTSSIRLQVSGFNGLTLTQAGRMGIMTSPGSTQIFDIDPTQTLTPAATDSLDAFLVRGSTVTVAGTAHVTTTTGYNYFTIKAPTYTKSSTASIDIGATLAIGGPPTGTVAPTTAFTLWAQGGNSRFDGGLLITSRDSSGNAILMNQAAGQTVYKTNGTLFVGTGDAHTLEFDTNATSAMLIDTSQRVGIGITPLSSTSLHVDRSQNAYNELFVTNNSSGTSAGSWIGAGLNPASDTSKTMVMAILGTSRSTAGLFGPQVGLVEHNPSVAANFIISTLGTADIVFATGGSRTEQMRLFNNGHFQIGSNTDLGSAFAVVGSTGKDSVTFSLQNGTVSGSPAIKSYFQVNQGGSTVADGNTSSLFVGTKLDGPSFSRAGVGATPSISEATSLYVSGEPTFSGTFSVGNRYAMHVLNGVARFDGGSAVNDSHIIWELNCRKLGTDPTLNTFEGGRYWVPVNVVGFNPATSGTWYMPLYGPTFGT